jgi:NADH-quinone oxidoreductase subunit M
VSELHLPWLEIAIVLPLLGALVVWRSRDPERGRQLCLLFTCLTFATCFAAWQDFLTMRASVAGDPWDLSTALFGREFFTIDELSAPLLPLASLLYLLTALATLRTKMRRFSFTWTLVTEAIVLATLSCKQPWGVVLLLAIGTIPPYWELVSRKKPTGVYVLHMALFVCLMALGWALVQWQVTKPEHSLWIYAPLVIAILIRSGIAPLHCWMTDLFEHATFGTALLFSTPMLGAYAAVRLLLPIAPDEVLRVLGMLALFTAVYAAGMALVQREARRFFCYVLLSHSALVLVGLDTVRPIGLTGALCVWLSVGLSLAGFGLTLRLLEARHGRLSLARYHGLYEHTPLLAICFFLTGMASVGFPGTLGFLGTELLVDGVVESYPIVGVTVVLAAALNGIALVKAYFLLFTGTRHVSSVPLQVTWREKVAVLTLAALILGGGLYPQPGVASRHHAALELLEERALNIPVTPDHGTAERDSDRHDAAAHNEWLLE